MQHIVKRLVSLVMLLLVFAGARAQKTDSMIIMKIEEKDKKFSIKQEKVKYDSVPRKIIWDRYDSVKRRYAHDMYKYSDSLKAYKRFHDSTYRMAMKRAYTSHDSARKVYDRKMRQVYDSMRVYKTYRDSAYRKTHTFKAYSGHDSLMKKYHDSSYRKVMRSYKLRKDSIYRKQNFETFRKLDSLKVKELKFRIVQDSLRMKIYKQQRDSVYRKLKEREVVMEVPAKNIKKIYINNNYQDVIVRTGDSRKIKLATMVYENEKETMSDAAWFSKLKTNVEETDSGMVINANVAVEKKMTMSVSATYTMSGTYTLTMQADSAKEPKLKVSRKVLHIDLPKDVPIQMVSRYSDVTLGNNMNDLSVDINNGKLVMKDATNAVIRSNYGKVMAGNITHGNVQMTNGKFDCASIDNLKVDSKYSRMNVVSAGKIDMKSLSDKYEVNQVNNLEGYKTFGQLNIQYLATDMVLKGTSADISVSNFGVNTQLVDISNKYADVKLPLTKLTNYSMSFDGINSRVLGRPDSLGTGKILPPLNSGKTFTATAGNLGALHTKLQLDCNNCVVDLR